MRCLTLPTASRLRELFLYDPDTGEISRRKTERPCGYQNHYGYVMIWADGRAWLAHRVIYKMMTGLDPKNVIDHINRVRNDNRWSNLRDVTIAENNENRESHPAHKFGLRGGYPSLNKWRADISFRGKSLYLGSYSTQAEACAAYRGAFTLMEKTWRAE